MFNISDYLGTRSLKLFTNFANTNLTSNRKFLILFHWFLVGIKDNNCVSAELTAVEFKDATWVRYMWWVYIIGLIWTSEFLLACQHMIISGAVAKWYFTKYVFHTLSFLFFLILIIF